MKRQILRRIRRRERLILTNELAFSGWLCAPNQGVSRRFLQSSVAAWKTFSRNFRNEVARLSESVPTAPVTLKKWFGDIEKLRGHAVIHPLIGESEFKVAKVYDMLSADAGDLSEGRTPARPTLRFAASSSSDRIRRSKRHSQIS
mgnify:CR=1 FL=1